MVRGDGQGARHDSAVGRLYDEVNEQDGTGEEKATARVLYKYRDTEIQ